MFSFFSVPSSTTIINGVEDYSGPLFNSLVDYLWIPIAVTVAVLGAKWLMGNGSRLVRGFFGRRRGGRRRRR